MLILTAVAVSNHDPLDLIETDLIAPAIVELRRARRGRLGPMNKKGLLAVSVGAFADPAFPALSQAVYAEHRHGWLPNLPAG